MSRDEYLWDPASARESVDPFAAELERRLAPLGDEVDALVDELELGDETETEAEAEAVVLTLPVAKPPAAERPRERSWPWLAAALVVLSASVFALARDQRRRVTPPVVDVSGPTGVAGRIELGVSAVSKEPTAHAVLVSLRDTHDELAGCALALAPGAELELHVGFGVADGVVTVDPNSLATETPELADCVKAALTDWDASGLGDGEVEIDLLLQNNRSEEREQ